MDAHTCACRRPEALGEEVRGMPEEARRKAMLAASSTRRTLDENIAAAAEVAYTAGRADERMRIVAWMRRKAASAAGRVEFARMSSSLAAQVERGEHLDD